MKLNINDGSLFDSGTISAAITGGAIDISSTGFLTLAGAPLPFQSQAISAQLTSLQLHNSSSMSLTA